MAFSFSSQDIRLFIGGTRVHGWDENSRTLTSVEESVVANTFSRTVIGDATNREGYTRRRSGSLNLSGFYDDEYGIRPLEARARTWADLPLTYSKRGDTTGKLSRVARGSIWRNFTVQDASDDVPCMVNAECHMNGPADALCIAAGQFTGGFTQNVGGDDGLELQTQPHPIHTAGLRFLFSNGNRTGSFDVQQAISDKFLADGDDISFDGVTGVFRVDDIIPGRLDPANNVAIEIVKLDGSVFSGPEMTALRAATQFRVVDTYSGERITVVQLSNITRRDATRLEVWVQGRTPGGATAWNPVGTATILDVTRDEIPTALWMEVPSSTRGVNRIRVQLRFKTGSTGQNNGGRTDYSVYARADHVPRVVHH